MNLGTQGWTCSSEPMAIPGHPRQSLHQDLESGVVLSLAGVLPQAQSSQQEGGRCWGRPTSAPAARSELRSTEAREAG